MTQFVIQTMQPSLNGFVAGPELVYDNQTSGLTWDDGSSVVPVEVGEFKDASVVSVSEPGRKGNVRTLKISLGLSCNYECSYCSQRFVPHAESTNPGDVGPFLTQVNSALPTAPERIEFWGGEPLVYWKTFKPLAEGLRELYPQAQFCVITNGSLLDAEKNAWLDRLGFAVGISHDGPGYHARGLDPLDDPVKRGAIMDLYARLHPQGRISINAMVHADNPSRASIQAWLQERFGADVRIGEGAFIDPYDEGGLASTFQSHAEHVAFRSQAFHELRTGKVTQFGIGRDKINGFVDSVVKARPASALGQKCGMDRASNLAVDLQGNVITCQNVSAASTAPNGQGHRIGHLSDLASVAMKTATHWSQRKDCPNCPVLQLCQGSCMFLEGKLWDAGCDAAYSDNIAFFVAAIEYLTGCIPFCIEGDFRADRHDVFGQVHGAQDIPKRRLIPIEPVTS